MRPLIFTLISLSSSLGQGLGLDPVVRRGRQQAIHGSCAGTANHQKGQSRQREEVVLITFSLLCTSPVHPEAESTMNQRDGYYHVAKDPKGCNAGEQSEEKTQTAKEFRGNGQKCECGRDVQHSREETHRAGEAISTKPSQHLLGTVGEEDHSKHQSKNSRCNVVVSGNQLSKHRNSLRRSLSRVDQTPNKMITLI